MPSLTFTKITKNSMKAVENKLNAMEAESIPKKHLEAITDELKIEEKSESLAHLIIELDNLRDQKRNINADLNEQIKELEKKILKIAKGQLELEFK